VLTSRDLPRTARFEGEAWLMHNGFAQAEGVANLDQAPEAGALVIIGYPKFGGGLGGYARYVAICPPDWPLARPSVQMTRRCRNPTSCCTTTKRRACAFVKLIGPQPLRLSFTSLTSAIGT